MARHYYLTRAGRLRRKDNTLAFEPVEDKSVEESVESSALTEEAENALPPMVDLSESLVSLSEGDGLGI